MQNLWAPWRSTYIQNASKNTEVNDCLFCRVTREDNDKRNYIVKRSKFSFMILNAYPYNTGHVMVVPYRHVPSIDLLSDDEVIDLFHLVKDSMNSIRNSYNPHGFNIGINIGRVAGAGIENHVHVHIVPRWNGDSNFMPVVSNTKVISETLEDTYVKLSKYWEKE
ncbi:HIT family protein [Sulfuracidifex tepidarius]|nr:HIT domain-containing protein [Sulfuracidifex tepidarius]